MNCQSSQFLYMLKNRYICNMKKYLLSILLFFVVFSSLLAQGSYYKPLSLRNDWYPTWEVKDKDNGLLADGAQYVPIALPWAMKTMGQPTRSGWGRMTVSHGIGVVAMAGGVKMLKKWVADVRPDATDDESFPSGHTAWAFLGATMIERELGWRSPWYTLGGYTFATAMAMQRVVDRRHFPVDVAGGAMIGVVAGHLGYYLGDKIFGDNQLENKYNKLSEDDENQSFLSLETGLDLNLTTYSIGNYKISREPSLNVGMKLGVPFSDNWGAAMGLFVRSTPIFFESQMCKRTFVAPENSVGVELSPYYRKQLTSRFSLNSEISCGYYRNFNLKSIERAISVNDDFFNARVAIGSAYRLTDNMSIGAAIGYEIVNVEYELEPNEIYGIMEKSNVSKINHSLSLNISTKVLF